MEYSEIVVPMATLVLASCVARYVHYALFERYFKLTFEDAPVWSFFYFSLWTAVVVFSFPEEMSALFGSISFMGYFALVILFLVVFPAVYRGLKAKVGNPEWLAELYPGQGMLSLEERYIFAKIADVVFQQCVAGAMVLTLVGHGLEYPQITVIFLILFTLAHLYLFRTAGFIWGFHYTAYAALGGFAFPFFIIFVPGGIAYALVLHMLFYVLSAAFFAKLPRPNTAVRSYLGA